MDRVAFHTLGCKVNQYETEAMEKLFQEKDYEIVLENEVADIYIINTCTVTNLSDRKSRQFIRRAKRTNNDSVVAVVGCYSQVSPDDVESIEEVDIVIGTSDRNKIVELCEEARQKNKKFNIVRDINTYDGFEEISVDEMESKTRAYMKIQDGCTQFCTYCIIPYARGPIRSRKIEDIINEAENLANKGFKEIILTGIHVASYGKDLGNIDLKDVIKEISIIDGIERIRLSSIEPNLIDDDFMRVLVDTDKVCNHFHLSLQSGSNPILRRMNRRYTREEFKEKIDIIRKYMPDAGITTDIIVGFPGETDEMFEETVELVKDIRFSKIHVFKYSPREGTAAARFKDQINGNIKNERSKTLIELEEKLSNEFNEKFIDKNIDVLYEEKRGNYYEGYTSNYIRMKSKSSSDIINSIVETKVIENEKGNLIGEIRR
ncbi:MAG TPA: tRNA (N(6)-L-threonylcarbamoyladenosine(37)-C(2))-methylthiotransferase MtaB [Tissierellaceae bacterium]|nr:tRNA (N(6)-L-threonylcarbamoyladenosine(37)-C(2))-methylthiotransferase MtaB [Tissierellaceae bacterium]